MLNNITLLQPLYPVFCAWCGGETNVAGYAGLPHSHGICPGCADRLLDEDEKGRTTSSLYDTETKELLPGHEMSMSAAMMKATQLELKSNE
jgi:hypothetical protein